MRYEYEGITLTCDTDIPEDEARAYIERYREMEPTLVEVDVSIDGDYANVSYRFHQSTRPFERIRRITGYLVGTLDRFNDGKRAEEADRVKHEVGQI